MKAMNPNKFDLEECRRAWERLSEALDTLPALSEEELLRITRSKEPMPPADKLQRPSAMRYWAFAASVVLVVGCLLFFLPKRQSAENVYSMAMPSSTQPLPPAAEVPEPLAETTPSAKPALHSVAMTEKQEMPQETSVDTARNEVPSASEPVAAPAPVRPIGTCGELICNNDCIESEVLERIAAYTLS